MTKERIDDLSQRLETAETAYKAGKQSEKEGRITQLELQTLRMAYEHAAHYYDIASRSLAAQYPVLKG